MDSDHKPVEIWIKGEEKRGREKGSRRKRGWRIIWNEKRNDRFVKKLRNMKLGKGRIGEKWDKMEKKVRDAVRKTEMELEKEKKRGW